MSNASHIEDMLLPHEDLDDYREHLAGLISAHQPSDAHEQWLVEEFAAASWAWRRARATDKAFWEYLGGHYNRGNTGIAEALAQEKEARFRTHLRHMAQAERQYYRALAAVERMRRDRGTGRHLDNPIEPAREERALAATAEPVIPSRDREGAVRAAASQCFFRDDQLTSPLHACYSEFCERARLTPSVGSRVKMKPGQNPVHFINSPPGSSSIS